MTKISTAVILLVTVILLSSGVGCTPRTFVRKNPDANDNGVRYYRPKPYLMVKAAVDKNGTPVPGYVSIETTMLPDFSEEYSIHIRSGLGSNDTSITLDDGWKLTALNVNVDSKVDENLAAAAEVAKGIPTNSIFTDTRVEVRAVNVPLGLYEAVVSKEGCKKRLYGFRYVGFMPFSNCPIEIEGCHKYSCESAPIYGLVFDQEANVMVFKPLEEIPYMHANRTVIAKDTDNDSSAGVVTGDPNLDVEDAAPEAPEA